MNKSFLLLFVLSAASLTAFAGLSSTNSISLRYFSAAEANEALQRQFGTDVTAAVRSVDARSNALLIDTTHPGAARVREFLVSFDRRPAQVRVDATVTRHLDATAEQPARNEIVSRWTAFGRADKPMDFAVPEVRGGARTELRVTNVPAELPTNGPAEKR